MVAGCLGVDNVGWLVVEGLILYILTYAMLLLYKKHQNTLFSQYIVLSQVHSFTLD